MNLESLNWRFRTQYTIQAKIETTNHVEQLTNWWQDHNTTNIVSDLVFVFVFWFYFIFSDWNSRWRKWKLCDLNGNELIHSRVGINNTHTHTLINNLNVCMCVLFIHQITMKRKRKKNPIDSFNSRVCFVLFYSNLITIIVLRKKCMSEMSKQTNCDWHSLISSRYSVLVGALIHPKGGISLCKSSGKKHRKICIGW